MKLVDVTARNSKELESLKRKVNAWLKAHKGSCNMGAVTWNTGTGGKHWVEVENDGKLGQDYLRDIIEKSPNTRNIEIKEYDGSYDWASDTYTRPASIVTFTF